MGSGSLLNGVCWRWSISIEIWISVGAELDM